MCATQFHKTTDAPRELFFSLKELQRLVAQENSCVSVVNAKRSITLKPFHLQNLQASVKELLQANVKRYDVQLEGIILAHKCIKLIMDNVKLSDSSTFSLEYIADIYVFKPKVGDRLTGIVNKCNNIPVNVLVHGIFNVSVYPSDKCENLRDLTLGSEVVVKVFALNYTGLIPFIKASVVSYCDNEKLDTTDSKKKKKERKHPKEQNSLIGISQREEPTSLIGVSQRKEIVSILKNSPLRIRQSSTEMDTQEAESSSTESSKAGPKGSTPTRGLASKEEKKRKKKSKIENMALQQVQIDNLPVEAEVHSSTEKESRKRKRDDDQDTSMSRKKKKKKDKFKDEDVEGPLILETSLNNTTHMMIDESIFGKASSTPVMEPPESPQKKKKKRQSDKADKCLLVESLIKLKTEGITTTTTSVIDTVDANSKGKSKKATSYDTANGDGLPATTDSMVPDDTNRRSKNDKSESKKCKSVALEEKSTKEDISMDTTIMKDKSRKKSKKSKTRQLEHPETDQLSLADALLRVKMEGSSSITNTTSNSIDQFKSEKSAIKQDPTEIQNETCSSEMDSQTIRKKKKKKVSPVDALAQLMLSSTLKNMKGEK